MTPENILAIMTILFLTLSYGSVMTIASWDEKVFFSIIFPLGILGVILGGLMS